MSNYSIRMSGHSDLVVEVLLGLWLQFPTVSKYLGIDEDYGC